MPRPEIQDDFLNLFGVELVGTDVAARVKREANLQLFLDLVHRLEHEELMIQLRFLLLGLGTRLLPLGAINIGHYRLHRD